MKTLIVPEPDSQSESVSYTTTEHDCRDLKNTFFYMDNEGALVTFKILEPVDLWNAICFLQQKYNPMIAKSSEEIINLGKTDVDQLMKMHIATKGILSYYRDRLSEAFQENQMIAGKVKEFIGQIKFLEGENLTISKCFNDLKKSNSSLVDELAKQNSRIAEYKHNLEIQKQKCKVMAKNIDKKEMTTIISSSQSQPPLQSTFNQAKLEKQIRELKIQKEKDDQMMKEWKMQCEKTQAEYMEQSNEIFQLREKFKNEEACADMYENVIIPLVRKECDEKLKGMQNSHQEDLKCMHYWKQRAEQVEIQSKEQFLTMNNAYNVLFNELDQLKRKIFL